MKKLQFYLIVAFAAFFGTATAQSYDPVSGVPASGLSQGQVAASLPQKFTIRIDGLSGSGNQTTMVPLFIEENGISQENGILLVAINGNTVEKSLNHFNSIQNMNGITAFNLDKTKNELTLSVSGRTLESVMTQLQNTKEVTK